MLQPVRLKRALEALRAAAQKSAATHDPKLRDAVVNSKVEELLAEIAGAAESEGLLQHAAQIFQLFEEIGLPREHSELMGQVIQGIGKTYERLGDAAHAYEAYEHALRLAREVKDDTLAAGCLRRMGRVMTRMARWDAAAEHFAESQRIQRRIRDRKGTAETLCDVGSLHYQKGDLDEAQKSYGKALELAEDLEHTALIINLRNNLGIVANVRGDVDTAIAHYQSCIPLAEQAGLEPLLAQAWHNLGMAYADRYQWKEAGDCYEKAMRLARKHSIANILGAVHLNRAEMYEELGDIDMAAVACGRALSIFAASQNVLGEAEVYRVLGKIFSRRNDPITSMEMFNLSLDMVKEVGAPLETAETYLAMGLAYERMDYLDDAIRAVEAALPYFEQVQARADREAAEEHLARLKGRSG